jgi:hypothetical protein
MLLLRGLRRYPLDGGRIEPVDADRVDFRNLCQRRRNISRLYVVETSINVVTAGISQAMTACGAKSARLKEARKGTWFVKAVA